MLQWWRVHVLLAGLGTLTSCAAVKVVGCIGDSITDGVGASVSGLPSPPFWKEMVFGEYVVKATPCKATPPFPLAIDYRRKI